MDIEQDKSCDKPNDTPNEKLVDQPNEKLDNLGDKITDKISDNLNEQPVDHQPVDHSEPKHYDTLVLSGGGVRGFCLLGGVQAIMDMGLFNKITLYVGTSIGAIISYLLIIGYTPIEIMIALFKHKWLEQIQHLDLVSMVNGNGAMSFMRIYEALEKLTLDKVGVFLTLGKLRDMFGKTLVCATYNMTKCRVEYISPYTYPDMPCLTALRMSANIPMMFERFKYMDSYYIDGGIADNFPIVKGVEMGKRVIGIYFEADESDLKDCPEDGMIAYLLKLLYIPMLHSYKEKADMVGNRCTIIPIKGKLGNITEFNVETKIKLNMFSDGYEASKKLLCPEDN